MRRGYFYSHPRFMDVLFLCKQAFPIEGNRIALKVDWYNTRGMSLGVTCKYKLSRAKALEFKEVKP